MKNGNGQIVSVQEKRELAKLIDRQYGELINELQQSIQYTEGEILEQAKKNFGLDVINQQIAHLNEKIKLLENKKLEMGFDRYDAFNKSWRQGAGKALEQTVDRSTKAGRFYYLKVRSTADVQALTKQRDQKLKELWLTTDRKQILSIANGQPKIKLIEYKAE